MPRFSATPEGLDVVAPGGAEPAARGLGNRCSIRLSYGAVAQEGSELHSRTESSRHAVHQTAMSSPSALEILEHPDVPLDRVARIGDSFAVGRGGRGVHPKLRWDQRCSPTAA